jgi:hypothetical protein
LATRISDMSQEKMLQEETCGSSADAVERRGAVPQEGPRPTRARRIILIKDGQIVDAGVREAVRKSP